MKYIVTYFITINILTLLLMFIDKRKAVKNKWRISETTLILSAILGGSVGSILGMYLFRHKTKHFKFKFGLPIILAIQIGITIFITIKK